MAELLLALLMALSRLALLMAAATATAAWPPTAAAAAPAKNRGGAAAAAAAPNLVVFFVDDLGYSDLSCFGGSEVITANIDRMAAEGMKLTTFYSAAPVCTPSRAGLLLGRLPKRTGFCGPGVMWCNSLSGIPKNETTWASVLQNSGRYATLMVGKWHLGHTPGHLPTDHGFDHFLGLPYSQDIGYVLGNTTRAKECDVKSCGNSTYGCYPLPLLNDTSVAQQPVNLATLTERYTSTALSFIHQTTNGRRGPHKKFALYYAFDHVHTPQFGTCDSPSESCTPSPRGPFGDALVQVDEAVGRVLHAIRELSVIAGDVEEEMEPNDDEIAERRGTARPSSETFAFLTSDNGAPSGGQVIAGLNAPFSGMKFQTWEGGVRMPAIAWWPGYITPASASTQLASTLDLFATILDFAGVSDAMPSDRIMDSYSLRSILRVPPTAREAMITAPPVPTQSESNARREMFLYNGCTLAAVRKGEWKAHYRTSAPSGNGGIGDGVYYPPAGDHDPPILYHIPTDPSERFPIIWNASTASRQDPSTHGLPARYVLSDSELLQLLADFNRTVSAHFESLGWAPPSRLAPNDWSARICCDPTTLPLPCWCNADAPAPRTPLKFDDGEGGPPVAPPPPPQSLAQRQLVVQWRSKATAASSAATDELLSLLARPAVRAQLPPVLRSLDVNTLLAQIEDQLAVTEIVHQFKPSRPANWHGAWCDDCAEGSQSDGNPKDSSFTAGWVHNLWELGYLNETSRNDIEGWCTGTSAAELFDYGFSPFSAVAHNPATVGWPASFAEAAERPVYAIANIEKIDAGVQQFGPVAVVLEPQFARDTVVLSACDTGGWEDSCGVQWWEMQCTKLTTAEACRTLDHGSTCAWKNGRCVGVAAKHGVEFNCSAGSTLGVPGHARHVLAASARLWTLWDHTSFGATERQESFSQATVDANLAMIVGRLLSPWNTTKYPLAKDHMDYYWEAAVVGTPVFPMGVLFIIGSFPDLFGTGVGLALQQWCVLHGWLLLWALGKNGDSQHGEFEGNRRLVDPIVAAQIQRSNLSPKQINGSTRDFETAWRAAAVAEPPLSAAKASELWKQTAKGLPPQMHVEPVMAGVCEPHTCVGIEVGGSACVCYRNSAPRTPLKFDDGEGGPEITLGAIDWSAPPLKVASTASTVEVDVMPFLSRVQEGGPFDAYFTALSDLGAEFVRFSPWYGYPRVVVTELTPPDCTATKPATNWNSTLFDAIMSDFMLAVCGPDAVSGKCKHSVAQQISTMPSWLYVGGFNASDLPADPWQYHGMDTYNAGIALVDETCKAMAGYMARVVSHYTSGGFHDECGHWHPSGLHYNWTVLSVLNEDEHHTGAARYTRCFDQIKLAVRKVNPTIMFAGPEGTTYTAYEIDPANHQDKDPSLVPEILSLHQGVSGWDGNWDGFFLNIDSTLAGVHNLTLLRDKLAPKSEFVTNELITFMYTWCDRESADALFEKHPDLKHSHAGACPDWQDPRSNSVKVNRKTLGWNAAAASFAYAYGQLALQGFKYVGQDQLIGGPWPDNEPSVSCLDWKTGQPNAKYYAISMLANALRAGPKSFFNISIQVPPPPPPAPPEEPITTLADCAAKAKGCAKANFVSFSAHNHECSWFEECIYSEPGGWPPLNVSEHTRLDPQMFGPTYGTYTSQVLKSTGSHKVGATAVGLCMESKKYASQNCSLTSPGSWDTRPGYNNQELPVSPLFALPFIVHEDAAKGILIVAKSEQGAEVVLTESPNGTTALVLEGVGSEPGFAPPVERLVGADGRLSLGPFGVAIVSFGT